MQIPSKSIKSPTPPKQMLISPDDNHYSLEYLYQPDEFTAQKGPDMWQPIYMNVPLETLFYDRYWDHPHANLFTGAAYN
jgi:hypothetical protein